MPHNIRKILLTITGNDEPGQLSRFMETLSRHKIMIEDIDQVTIYGHLVLVILIGIDDTIPDHSGVLKDLLFEAKELKLDLDFLPFTDEELARPIYAPARYVVTIIAPEITTTQFCYITSYLGERKCNITRIRRLQSEPVMSYELSIQFHEPLEPDLIQQHFMQLANKTGVDIALQKESIFRRAKRMVVFDLDSTLIQEEVIDQMASLAGLGDQVAALTAQAMEGKMDIDEAFTRRIALFNGLPESIFEDVWKTLHFNEGVENLVEVLKKLGYKMAIISGGFLPVAEKVRAHLGIDYVFANQLEVVDGKLTGKHNGAIINADRKAELLCEISSRESISTEQVIAIGDGANDLKMLAAAGMGIAFHAKPIVKESAQVALTSSRIDAVLSLLGFAVGDLDALMEKKSV